MKLNLLKTTVAAAAMLLAVPTASEAQNLVFPTGNPVINSAAFGSQIGHRQQGNFGDFTPDDRWIGIGNPTFMGGLLPVYGMRIQDQGEIATFSLNKNNDFKDLDIQWGPEEKAQFHLNFIKDPTDPNGIVPVMTALSNGRVSMGTTNPSNGTLTLRDYNGSTYALEARTFANNTRGAYITGQYIGIDARIQGSTSGTIFDQRYGVYSQSTSANGDDNFGVYGVGTGGVSTNYGVRGFAQNANATGTAYGVYGSAGLVGTNFAGYFAGNVTVTGAFSSGSDRRLKDNIETEVNAMDRIMQLRPTTYEFKKDEKFKEMYLAEGLQHGFIAQEVEEVFPEMIGEGVHYLGDEQYTDLDGIEKNGEQEVQKFEFKTVNYMAMIPVLTKGIQEQQAEIEIQAEEIADKDARIAQLEADMAVMRAQLDQVMESSNKGSASSALDRANVLYQNTPNPFSAQTEIRYALTEGTQNAEVLVFDMNGRQIRAYSNLKAGDNSLVIDGAELEAGMYFYSLIVNGAEVDTKRMILTK